MVTYKEIFPNSDFAERDSTEVPSSSFKEGKTMPILEEIWEDLE
jgi:hypothetical protein